MISPADKSVTASELTISLRSLPYLADHGFQDATVLPGSFYIDMALRMMSDAGRIPRAAHRVTFRSPVILSEPDRILKVQVTDVSDGLCNYSFYEAHAGDASASPSMNQFVASLDIEHSQATSVTPTSASLSPETFRAQPHTLLDSEQFYGTLRSSGNHYGPRFQNVSAVWRAGDECLGEIRVPDPGHLMHPAVLDSVIQVLAAFILDHGRTFVLQSIDRIAVPTMGTPKALWVYATRVSGGERHDSAVVGNLRAFDAEGRTYVELLGVAFSLLGSVEAIDEHPAMDLRIAANFTAEPLEDSLRFWCDYFGVQPRLDFSPYNQVFQQLLGRASTFSSDNRGFNIVLLELERWANVGPAGTVLLNEDRAKEAFEGLSRYRLPNGLEIVDVNRYETDYVYKEIFEDKCYLRHGISLHDGDTVVDVGANIGLFSLFVMTQCRHPRILAFEPSPVVYPFLRANCQAYGDDARVFNVGVSRERGTAPYTFYEKSTVFSGFHANERDDRAAIATVVQNIVAPALSSNDKAVARLVDHLTTDRLRSTTYECPLTSVSAIISDNQLERIHLLKIDAEKSELAILQGIEESDWEKIDQLVIEVHDASGSGVTGVEQLLLAKGYRCAKEEEPLLERSGLFTIYATQDNQSATAEAHAAAKRLQRSQALSRHVDGFCEALEALMARTTTPLIMAVCPSRPGAEADQVLRKALEQAEQALLTRAARIPNVQTISSQRALMHYPVQDFYDPDASRLGQIPYTAAGYAAIGTSLFRTAFNWKRAAHKVMVVDCDNTLWKGACGEDGVTGIAITEPYRILQAFIKERVGTGMLLCLCSKNNDADVMDVFDQRSDMVLKREHIVARRINWGPKSANIQSLATELNVSLDSIIFLDDNPVECAEVRSNCPTVLTLQLPSDPASVPSFLDHIWPFDHTKSTQEDHSRTRMYQDNTARQVLASQVRSLNDFIRALELRVQIREPTADELGRVSQLTIRTNQFNFTTKRRSEHEVQTFLNDSNARSLVVHASDRFGDYGLVGAVLYHSQPDRYIVDTFLLSCRVLGKGVEHRVIAALGSTAAAERKPLVELRYSPTAKNAPAWEFLRSIARHLATEAINLDAPAGLDEGAPSALRGEERRSVTWRISAASVAGLEYDADEDALAFTAQAGEPVNSDRIPSPIHGDLGGAALSDKFQHIGEQLSDITHLVEAIDNNRRGRPRSPASIDVLPCSAVETAIADIWTRVLQTPQVSRHENFFEAGGTSLTAVRVIASINRELKADLSLISIFECPTVALLASRLTSSPVPAGGIVNDDPAATRGRQRRRRAIARRAS